MDDPDKASFVETRIGTCQRSLIPGSSIFFISTNATECGTAGICGPQGSPVLRYGFSGSCTAGNDASTVSMIDFVGTSFAIAEPGERQWETAGSMSASNISLSDDKKQATIRGGGLCG